MSVLVINIWPGGAEDASALVRNLGYSFKLAHAPEGWEHSLGQGANFIIDKQGRVVFRPHFNGPGDLTTANRLIAGLLRQNTDHNLEGRMLLRSAARLGVTGA